MLFSDIQMFSDIQFEHRHRRLSSMFKLDVKQQSKKKGTILAQIVPCQVRTNICTRLDRQSSILLIPKWTEGGRHGDSCRRCGKSP
mmetsp:Transcript_5835/g.18403  ORF Transcript_5835/g.18403 Transcript_5835/m.18403 type:complete len:86 (+) Transcript_5835:109-366(+)